MTRHRIISRRADNRARPCAAIMAPQAGPRRKDEGPFDKTIFTFEAKGLPRFGAVAAVITASISLGGCATKVAPSYELFGAFFPAWMLCALVGIIGGIAARVVFIATGIDSILQFRLFVCLSAGLLVAALTWLFWFGR